MGLFKALFDMTSSFLNQKYFLEAVGVKPDVLYNE